MNPYEEIKKMEALQETERGVKIILEYIKELKVQLSDLKTQLKETKETIKNIKK